MNRQQAKEIADLSADTYAAAGFFHQACLAKYGDGVDIQIRLGCYEGFTDDWGFDFLKDEIAKWRVKSDIQIINGIGCATPISNLESLESLAVVYFETVGFDGFYHEIEVGLLQASAQFHRWMKIGIVYDCPIKAATACKLRHGVAP